MPSSWQFCEPGDMGLAPQAPLISIQLIADVERATWDSAPTGWSARWQLNFVQGHTTRSQVAEVLHSVLEQLNAKYIYRVGSIRDLSDSQFSALSVDVNIDWGAIQE
jgi:hypothetical protein